MLAFVWVGIEFGLREAFRSVAASLLPSFIAFALTVCLLFLPALLLARRLFGSIRRLLASSVCVSLSLLLIFLLNIAYGGRGNLLNYESAFIFTLLGAPGAIFGWFWPTAETEVGAQ